MVDEDEPPADTPEAFLAALSKSLASRVGEDTELARILAAHLIRVDPCQTAVASAKDAIMRLAAERAYPGEDGGDDG